MSYNLIYAAYFINMCCFVSLVFFFLLQSLPTEDIENTGWNRLKFKQAHWITANEPAKCTSPFQYTWSPGIKIAVVIFSPRFRAVPQPRNSKAAPILQAENGSPRGYGTTSVPLECSSKNDTTEQLNHSKILIHKRNNTIKNPNFVIYPHYSRKQYPECFSLSNPSFLSESPTFATTPVALLGYSHLVGLCHLHTNFITEKISSLRTI